jgi:hypothetical protein
MTMDPGRLEDLRETLNIAIRLRRELAALSVRLDKYVAMPALAAVNVPQFREDMSVLIGRTLQAVANQDLAVMHLTEMLASCGFYP